MSLERLRNVKTGEYRDVETNSDEYAELINEVYDHDGSARPKWEIQGQHVARRIDSGEIRETDLGEQFKPIPGAEVDISEVGPEQHPERALTQGEVDSGIKSHEEKMKDLQLVEHSEPNAALATAEPLEREPVPSRVERGKELAGSGGEKRRSSRSSRRSSGSSGSGSGSSSSSGSAGSSGSSGGSDS